MAWVITRQVLGAFAGLLMFYMVTTFVVPIVAGAYSQMIPTTETTGELVQALRMDMAEMHRDMASGTCGK